LIRLQVFGGGGLVCAPPWDADFALALAANDEIDQPFFDGQA